MMPERRPHAHNEVLGTGFYKGRIAEAIVQAVQTRGGVLELADLESHETRRTSSISTTYRGLHIHEIPPPTQVCQCCMHMWHLSADQRYAGCLQVAASVRMGSGSCCPPACYDTRMHARSRTQTAHETS